MSKMEIMPVSHALQKDPDWWRGAVIYQIYPRSYQDSSGTGTGDLKGIASRLPHIANLGVDAIWISPFFKSPMADFGYDVSDYCDVDPMFGTLADFDQVIETAHNLNIKVMIDLVLSHTSERHAWFEESRISRTNQRHDWYVWSDPKPDGTPPNNWLSIFGGSAWQWDARREQYYLHNFLTSQPDLNFHNPAVLDALLDVAHFWLERGVDGFRLDTINFYVHDQELRSNPALPPEKRNATIAPSVNPYNHQEHLYSKNRPENLDFLRRFRAVMDKYGAAAVGEVGDAQRGLEIMAEYTAGNDLMQMCYAFEFLAADTPTAARFSEVLHKVEEVAANSWACWAFSNHDVVRHVTRWNLSDPAARVMATLNVCLRGSVCFYQGEELGLPEAEVPYEDLQDPYGIEFWPEFKGRDGCRTPMVWEQSNLNGGFSEGTPWLPVSPVHLQTSVAEQTEDPGSMLNHYKAVIALRHAYPALARGSHHDIANEGDVLRFTRSLENADIFCAFNLSDDPATITLPSGTWTRIGADLGSAVLDGTTTTLAPWQPCLALRTS